MHSVKKKYLKFKTNKIGGFSYHKIMYKALALTFLFLIFGCGKKSMKTKSTITPLFAPTKLSERYGDGQYNVFRIKIPLTKHTIGQYDYSEVAEDELANKIDRTIVQNLWTGLKYTLFNWGVGLGISNRIKYATDFEVPTISPEYFDIFQSVKINKIFFSIMPCDRLDRTCLTREEQYPVSFMFLDKFFVNISAIENVDNFEFIKEPLQFLSKGAFDEATGHAFRQLPIEFSELGDNGEDQLSLFYRNINLTKFHNSKKMDEFEKNVRDEGKVFLFHLSKKHMEFFKMFKEERFLKMVKDTAMIGTTVYVELFSPAQKKAFFKELNAEGKTLQSLGVNSFTGCSYVNCLYPEVNPINFVPLFKKSSHLKLDTFMSIRHLDYNDFQYKGFVEFEIKMKLPI